MTTSAPLGAASTITTTTAAATIDVVGTGRASAPPDIVRVRLAATALRATVAAAIADSEAAARRVRAAVTSLGVAARDAATLGLSVNIEQEWTERKGSRITGFRSDHELLLSLREMDAVGRLLGEALAAGSDDIRLHGVEFAVEDETPLRAAARESAWQDALARASQLAQLAGRVLGPVQQISETGGFVHGPVMSRVMAASAVAKDMDVQPGTVGIDVVLAIQWTFG